MDPFLSVTVSASTLLLFAGSALLAFLIALAVTPIVGALARRIGLLDTPGGRRTHPEPIPRIGGLGIAIAFGLAVFAFWLVDRLNGHPFLIPEEVRTPRFTLTAMAAFLGLAVGVLDDALDLRARWQLLGYFAIAAIIVAAGIRVDFINDPRGDGLIQLAPPIAIGFTVFWIVGMNNALNFIDGLDGLAAGVAAIAAVALGATALLPAVNEPFVAWMNFTLAGAIAGFLVFNVHPAKVFLGTTGVAFVGTMLAVLSIFGTAKVAAALLVLGVPIIDTFYVIVRRLVTGQAPFAPDRGHFHHKLLDVGLSHRQAVLLIYAITLGLGALAFLSSGRAQTYAFVGVLVLFGVVVLALSQRSAKAEELDPSLYPEKAE
ncbi:MAG TPA: MraY family glycosyltransferase [Candidatus Limnocylindria bacterium]|nr:MraY family glycosyltransferase [Candidatus Limnocylindria bacterium]